MIQLPKFAKSDVANFGTITLALIEDRGIAPTILEYLDTPPDVSGLKHLLALLGKAPREVLRKGKDAYRDDGLGNPALDDDALIAVMVANPILIERPVVVAGGKAALSRPPESVLEVL